MRNFKKRRYIALGILLMLFLINITVFFNSEKNRVELDPIEYSLPKMSDPDITIITPINKTYIEPMSGYYPATYGFENDIDGTSPEGWVNHDAPACVSQIISGLDGHNKVLRQNDNDNGLAAVLKRTFTLAQDHGTIEYFARASVVTGGGKIALFLYSTSGLEIWIILGDSKIHFWNGTMWEDIIPSGVTANTWYHFSVRWRSTGAPVYEGLAEGEWKIFIDEVEYGNYNLLQDDAMTSISIESAPAPWNFNVYWDAFGFDWHPNYDIGDNLNEGLLLSFENTTALDWMGYSLDGQANKTILGNTTIQMPDDGLHTIQMFGNDSVGTIHQSDVRHFSIFHIDIVTPENKIYTEPMSGYYPATYGFENDEDGSFPMEWIDDSIGASSEVIVASEITGHKKVLSYFSSFSGEFAHTRINLSNPQTSGSIEYYVYKNSGYKGFEISLRNSTNDYALRIGIDYQDDSQFWWRTSGSTAAEFGAGKYADNTWFHIRIDFDILTKKFDIYLDGIKEVDQEDLVYDITTLQNLQFYQTGPFGGHWYLDALSFSWDPHYDIGENLNEGLHLSFENSTTLDWTGYSLDGQANLTILGNSTIPMPEDGFHSIQMFGNDSVGTIYQSDIQPFSVDTEPPEITITSPSQNQFFGSAAPNFAISIVEPNLNTTWYTLDGGTTNITSVGLTGTINQTEWNKIVADSVTIRFYANDTFGFEGNAQVVINKDLNPPQSSISHEGLTFTITADDGLGSGVSGIRYRINGSAWIDYTSPFNLDYGIYNITYYAIDAVGNVEGEGTLIINLREPPNGEEPPGVPGYSPLIIMSTILIAVVIFIITFQRKNQKYRKF